MRPMYTYASADGTYVIPANAQTWRAGQAAPAEGPVVPLDHVKNPFQVSIIITAIEDNPVVTLEFTLDNIQDADVTPHWTTHPDADAEALATAGPTSEVVVNFDKPVTGIRLSVAEATPGVAVMRVIQAG